MNRAAANATMAVPRWTITKKGTTKMKAIEWTDEYQRAFKELKASLASPPLLNPSKPDEEFFLYLVVSLTVVSSALIQKEDRVQSPVCYTSRVLRRAEERYPFMGKLASAQALADFVTKFMTNKAESRGVAAPWKV